MATAYQLNREPSAAPARPVRARAAVPARGGVLSAKQKARLCQLANAAAEACGVTGWREKIAWRRAEQLARFGLASLTAATQEQYAGIKAHFEVMASKADRAFATELRGQDNKRRVARWNLEKALRESGLRMAYAIAICKRQYRCGIEDATEKQLWQLVYTLRNRGSAKRKKAGESKPTDNCPF